MLAAFIVDVVSSVGGYVMLLPRRDERRFCSSRLCTATASGLGIATPSASEPKSNPKPASKDTRVIRGNGVPACVMRNYAGSIL